VGRAFFGRFYSYCVTNFWLIAIAWRLALRSRDIAAAF